jgi:hypothetical protein
MQTSSCLTSNLKESQMTRTTKKVLTTIFNLLECLMHSLRASSGLISPAFIFLKFAYSDLQMLERKGNGNATGDFYFKNSGAILQRCLTEIVRRNKFNRELEEFVKTHATPLRSCVSSSK